MLSRCVVYSKPSHLPGHTTISLSLELENESCQLTPCIDIVLNRTWTGTGHLNHLQHLIGSSHH